MRSLFRVLFNPEMKKILKSILLKSKYTIKISCIIIE